MRRILTVGLACLWAFTVTVPPASAADLGMPLKAPPLVTPVEVAPDYTWLWIGLGLAAVGVGIACAVDFCEHHHHNNTPPLPPTTGANSTDPLPST